MKDDRGTKSVDLTASKKRFFVRGQVKTVFLLFIALAIAVATAVAALRGLDLNSSAKPMGQQGDMVDESQFPIADYNAPELADLEKRAKRQAKGRKYDKSTLPVGETADATYGSTHWAESLSAIPVAESNLVVIGTVIDAKAFLSPDKTGVYSEFTIRVEKTLKSDNATSVTLYNSIVAERPGGRVRFPSGRVNLYTDGQGMPLVGHRYVLFLTRHTEEQDFNILTGYELRDGHVFLLDDPGGGHPITAYRGRDEKSFLQAVQEAISKASPTTSK